MKHLPVLFVISALAFTLSLWLYKNDKEKQDVPPAPCTSHTTLIHGPYRIDTRMDFVMTARRGTLRILGSAYVDGKDYPVSRQIQFSYSHAGNTYILQNTQLEILSNDRGGEVGVQEHFPSFFNEVNRRLTMVIQQDKYKNYLMSFGNVPVFYCIVP